MPQRIVQVDAFADRPFAGNPAAVCLLDGPGDAGWMQAVALEMNLSETAFLEPEGDGYHLRWFSPTVEVDLCGHATLASAHVLWEDGHLAPGATARFRTRSGMLSATRLDGWITLDFPAERAGHPVDFQLVEDAIGAPVLQACRNRFDVLAEVESEAVVRSLAPDMTRVGKIPGRGLIVTATATAPGCDFVSRFFGPQSGVPEDPVTGSAHCFLGPYWGDRLGRSELVGYQASGRGGTVRVRLEGDRVLLGGRAVTVLRGELVEPASSPAWGIPVDGSGG